MVVRNVIESSELISKCTCLATMEILHQKFASLVLLQHVLQNRNILKKKTLKICLSIKTKILSKNITQKYLRQQTKNKIKFFVSKG